MTAIGLTLTVCAWCSRELHREIVRSEYPEFRVSHGVCWRCTPRGRALREALEVVAVIAIVVLACVEWDGMPW